MKIICSILNILALAFLMYIMSKGVYIDLVGYAVFGLSIILFFLGKGQWVKSGFLVIAVIFNPVEPIILTQALNVVMCSIFILYNIYYVYRVNKFKEI